MLSVGRFFIYIIIGVIGEYGHKNEAYNVSMVF